MFEKGYENAKLGILQHEKNRVKFLEGLRRRTETIRMMSDKQRSKDDIMKLLRDINNENGEVYNETELEKILLKTINY